MIAITTDTSFLTHLEANEVNALRPSEQIIIGNILWLYIAVFYFEEFQLTR